MRFAIVLLVPVVLAVLPASAQFAFAPPAVDLTGEWAPRV